MILVAYLLVAIAVAAVISRRDRRPTRTVLRAALAVRIAAVAAGFAASTGSILGLGSLASETGHGVSEAAGAWAGWAVLGRGVPLHGRFRPLRRRSRAPPSGERVGARDRGSRRAEHPYAPPPPLGSAGGHARRVPGQGEQGLGHLGGITRRVADWLPTTPPVVPENYTRYSPRALSPELPDGRDPHSRFRDFPEPEIGATKAEDGAHAQACAQTSASRSALTLTESHSLYD